MKYKNYIKFAALLPLLALLGCEANETPGAESQETVPVTIRLGLEKDGLSTRADDGYANTSDDIDDSKITSLDVYIMNGSTVEEHLTWDRFTDNLANDIELTTGTKQVYAIANYSDAPDNYVENSAVNALEKITSENGIPMSADTTWTVSSDRTEPYPINLVRMVAKMYVQIHDKRNNSETNSSNYSLTIEDLLPSTTHLYRNTRTGTVIPTVSLPQGITSKDWIWDNFSLTNNMATSNYFYLHETTGNFKITLKEGSEARDPRTFEATIPRNFIFPLVVYITNYNVSFKIETTGAPIGVIPINRESDGTLSFNLPEGFTFKITTTIHRNMEGSWDNNATWNWEVDNKLLDFGNTEPSWPENAKLSSGNESFTFEGKVSAITTDNKCNITITMKDGSVSQTFPVVIGVRALEDGDASGTSTNTTRSTSSEMQPFIIEL